MELQGIAIVKSYKVDSYRVCQYEHGRFVDVVEVKKMMCFTALCYSPKYRANVFVRYEDLKEVSKPRLKTYTAYYDGVSVTVKARDMVLATALAKAKLKGFVPNPTARARFLINEGLV